MARRFWTLGGIEKLARSAPNCDGKMESKQFCTKKTAEQMSAESKEATAKEMACLLGALSALPKEVDPFTSDSGESYTSSEESSHRRRRRGKQSSHGTDRLERRIHYLKLDYANQMVDLQKAQEDLKNATDKLDVLTKIDKNLIALKEICVVCNTGNSGLSIEQLDKKHSVVQMEMKDLLANTKQTLQQIEYSEVKLALQNTLHDQANTMQKALDDLYWFTTKKVIIRGVRTVSLVMILVLLLAFTVYYLV